MKGKYLTLLLLAGVLPILAVGGIGWFALWSASSPSPTASVSSGAATPDLNEAQGRMQNAASSMLLSIQGAQGDVLALAAKSSESELESFLTAHRGFSAAFHLGTDGKPTVLVPAGSTAVDAAYGSTEEFQGIQKRGADPAAKWPYVFYSRRGAPSLLFVAKAAAGGYVGAVLDIGSFFKGPGYDAGECLFVDAGSGQVLFSSSPDKVGTPFNVASEPWRAGVLDGLNKKTPGSQSTPQGAAAYAPLGLASFGMVQLIPFHAGAAATHPVASRPAGKNLNDPAEWLHHPFVWGLAGALLWVLVVGMFLRSAFLKPLEKARQVLESAVAGKGKVSDDALKQVAAPEVQDLVRLSSRWADRLEREKDDLSRRREEDAKRAEAQLQQRGAELADAVQKLGAAKGEVEEKDHAVSSKQQELDALKSMSEGLRNQAEQARGEIAKLKTQYSNLDAESKQKEADLRRQMDQQATETADQLKDLETKLLQVVAAAGSITVSRVRVAAIKTMSEELKTTLGIIKGYVSSALGSAQGGITEKQQEFLGMVINRSARLEKFINDLVDVYQVEIDQETAPREEVSLASEIEGMAFNFQPQADIKNIKIRVEEKGGPLPKVPIVRRRFTQLWNILYLQIIKDSPRGSQVPVTVEKVGEDVKVTVQDPGLNVKPEHLPKLFDEFYDPKHPASTQLAGTGLKFALVKTILGAHGGGCLAEKAENGTRLILTFPTKVKPKENPAAAILAQVKLPSASTPPKGGLLGAVKPGIVLPKAAAAPGTFAPKANVARPLPGAPVKPATQASGLDALLSGKAAPEALAPTAAPAPKTPVTPRPLVPPPAAPLPKAPEKAAKEDEKPAIDLEKLFEGKAETSSPAAPKMPAPPPPPMTAIPAGLKPPPSPPPIPGAPKAALPPIPTAPKAPLPPPVPAPKIVQTSLKPTAPPPGILDLDNQDGMKTEETAAPKPPAPKPAAPPPGAPPAGGSGKPIVKDLDKENGDSGDLIE